MADPVAQAPAKLNLYLHVTGKRADGYHTLESLVTFLTLCDTLRVRAALELELSIDGEFAGDAGGGEDNLVLKAARLLQAHSDTTHGAALRLTKNIPVGAGLGGGSADAAATLRVLNEFWGLGLDAAQLHALAVSLGADVAMCLAAAPAIARGIGEELTPCPHPMLHFVLVYPRTPLLTADVFRALNLSPVNRPVAAETVGATPNAAQLCALLARTTRNDLQFPAITLRPEIAEALLALETLQPAAELVRMSGSGACCFAVYTQEAQAARAADYLRAQYPQWWVQTAATI